MFNVEQVAHYRNKYICGNGEKHVYLFVRNECYIRLVAEKRRMCVVGKIILDVASIVLDWVSIVYI